MRERADAERIQSFMRSAGAAAAERATRESPTSAVESHRPDRIGRFR